MLETKFDELKAYCTSKMKSDCNLDIKNEENIVSFIKDL